MTMTKEASERLDRLERIEAWYAAETVALRARQLLIGAGLILKNAEYPAHLDIYGGLRMTVESIKPILEHFSKGSTFEEKHRPRGE